MTKGFGKAVAEIALDENKGSAEAALAWLQTPANLQSAEARAESLKAQVRCFSSPSVFRLFIMLALLHLMIRLVPGAFPETLLNSNRICYPGSVDGRGATLQRHDGHVTCRDRGLRELLWSAFVTHTLSLSSRVLSLFALHYPWLLYCSVSYWLHVTSPS